MNGPVVYEMLGITAVLTEAGLDAGATSWWFEQPRRELGGLSPHDALTEIPTAGRKVLGLARCDAAELITFGAGEAAL